MAKYSNSIKKEMCIKVCVNKESTILVANNYNVPIKTFEKWITAFNKDCSVFDENKPIHYQASQSKPSNNDYDSMNIDELKKELMRRDIEISRLKKRILCERAWSSEGIRYLQNEDYKTIMELSCKYNISTLCEEMGINRSGFYKWMDRLNKPSVNGIMKV